MLLDFIRSSCHPFKEHTFSSEHREPSLTESVLGPADQFGLFCILLICLCAFYLSVCATSYISKVCSLLVWLQTYMIVC